MKPNWKEIRKKLIKIENTNANYISGFDFSIIMQNLLISEHGYVIDTGNWENVNYVIAYKLIEKIKKHPLIWRLFFMIA